MKRTLFDISEDLLTLADLLDEQDGDVTETEAQFDAWFSELGEERDAKLDAYAYLIKETESEADRIKDEIDRLRARKTAAENKAKRLKERLEIFLKVQDIEKIKTDRFTFALQKPGGKPRVEVAEYFTNHPEELPESLRRVKFEANLEAIRELLETGGTEAEYYGRIVESEKRLRIR
jgi:chromosome segregation ATPase